MLEMLLRMGCTVPTHTIGGSNFLHALCRSSATYPCAFKLKFFVENGLGVNERSAVRISKRRGEVGSVSLFRSYSD